jgi:NAD(P)-dependent dehydrogenase (short-subunit alcohol dehydrogenase family)
MKLRDRVAVITGAGAGQGRAAAMLFADEGAAIVAVDIDEAAARQTAGEITAREGRAAALRADVAHEPDVAAMIALAIERFGQIDILYNNAGIDGEAGGDPFDMANYDRVVNVNLRGPVMGMKYALPHMLKRGRGVIINTSSIAATLAIAGAPGYAISKAGIIALTRTAGLLYGAQGIRVNCIVPGPIDTAMWRKTLGPEAGGGAGIMRASSPMGRPGKPEEVARLALFLASDDSSFAVGRPFLIDGAYSTGEPPG